MNYRRILLKISGEMLGNEHNTFDYEKVLSICEKIAEVHKTGVEIGIVIGGGNIFRGATGHKNGIDQRTGDYMGMLATVINSLAIKDCLTKFKIESVIKSALDIPKLNESPESAISSLLIGKIVIFAGGTGNPFFSTDTAAVLRAREIQAEVVLKATKVDGIYDKDPLRFSEAKKFDKITFAEAIEKNLQIMDMTAFSLCMETNMHIIVFNLSEENSILNALKENISNTIVCKKID